MSFCQNNSLSTFSAVIAVVLLISLVGCGIVPPPNIRPEQANTISLDPQNWYIYYSAEMRSHPVLDPSGAWSFEFPSSQADGHVNYVQTPFTSTKALHDVSLTFKVESEAPRYNVMDSKDIPPATVHLFFEQQNDDLRNANGRWWATASKYDLGSSDNSLITFVIPLTPDQWSNVEGQRDTDSFYAAIENVGWIGLTCGGQAFFGHGVALNSGTAKYVLVDLNVR